MPPKRPIAHVQPLQDAATPGLAFGAGVALAVLANSYRREGDVAKAVKAERLVKEVLELEGLKPEVTASAANAFHTALGITTSPPVKSVAFDLSDEVVPIVQPPTRICGAPTRICGTPCPQGGHCMLAVGHACAHDFEVKLFGAGKRQRKCVDLNGDEGK